MIQVKLVLRHFAAHCRSSIFRPPAIFAVRLHFQVLGLGVLGLGIAGSRVQGLSSRLWGVKVLVGEMTIVSNHHVQVPCKSGVVVAPPACILCFSLEFRVPLYTQTFPYKHRRRRKALTPFALLSFDWVAVQELNLSYYLGEP